MIEPIVSLAYGMHSAPGVYAVLAGSGVSRAASVPTGWEVTLELIRRVAALSGSEVGSDPENWYRREFDEPPSYSRLLAQLAGTPAARQEVLREFFEPGPHDDHDDEGTKRPTAFHRCIARLVASGHVRVVVTTNFDRLFEAAFADEGVQPVVVSSEDGAKGAPPVTHVRGLLIKVNGDYLDRRIRNTDEELSSYGPKMRRLLRRIFDDFGLVVCGWSGDWDHALREAALGTSSRVFPWYWAAMGGKVSSVASQLVTLREAQVISIHGADDFAAELHEKVTALTSLTGGHPLSPEISVAAAKRYLARDEDRIRLRDLVHHETEKARELTGPERLDFRSSSVQVGDRLRAYETALNALMRIVATGCYWGDESHTRVWTESIQRMAGIPVTSGRTWLIALRLCPASLILYSGCLGAIAGGNYTTLHTLLGRLTFRERGRERSASERLHYGALLSPEIARTLPGMERAPCATAEKWKDVCRSPLGDLVPSDDDYARMFERLEILWAVSRLGRGDAGSEGANIPIARGSYWWTVRQGDEDPFADLENEAMAAGDTWGPTQAGMFSGSVETYLADSRRLHAEVRERARRIW